MILKRITDYILRGRPQAMGAAFVLAFIPVLGMLSTLIAAFVTLRKGIQEGALVFVAAILPVLLAYSSMQDHTPNSAIDIIDVVVMMVSINMLTWIYAIVLRYTFSWGWVLQVAGLIGVVAVLGLHWIYPNIKEWWGAWLTNYFATAQDSVKPHVLASTSNITKMIDQMKMYATGGVVVVLSFYALLEVLIARWWQDAIFNPGGLKKELLDVRMSWVAGGAFLLGMVLAFFGNAIVLDVMPIFYMFFALAGLSLFNYVAAATKLKWVWIVLIYAIISLKPICTVLIAIIALLDSVLDFRKRLPIKIS